MSTLVKLNTQPTDQYDWNLIEDHNNRSVAKSTVSNYVTQWTALRTQADKLIETNTLALSKCVYTLKETLPHGEFTSVCQQALKLSSDKAGSLATVGRALMNGDVPEEALKLLNQMEPRAARQFLKADTESKISYVADFEKTGRVPSQRDFQAPKVDEPKHRHVTNFDDKGTVQDTSKEEQITLLQQQIKTLQLQLKNSMDSYKDETVNNTIEPTQNKWEAKDRFSSYKIRLVDGISAMTELLTPIKQVQNPSTKEALESLVKEAQRLLKETKAHV